MHKPIMLKETIKYLDINAKDFYIDTTFGLGGHTKELLTYSNADTRIILFDKNKKAYLYSKNLIKKYKNINSFNIAFELFTLLSNCYKLKEYSGIIADLGVSSQQLLDSTIGLGNKTNSFLDMRVNSEQKIRALDWLNKATKNELIDIFNILSNKKLAITLTKNILHFKKTNTFRTSENLTSLLQYSTIKKKTISNLNKILNLIRIFINDDLKSLIILLKHISYFLKKNGILIIISFNSLEDRIIKKYNKTITFTEKKPSINELQNNLSAKSAVMRVLY